MQLPLLILWCGIPVLAVWQICAARGRRLIDRKCPSCGYGVVGTRVGDPCPECGKIPAVFRPKPASSDQVVCRGCRHDLKGLKWDADCPECGLHRAALPRFASRQTSYRSRSLLGSILLAMWMGLTLVMVMT